MIDVGLPRVAAARITVVGLALTQRMIVLVGAGITTTIVIDVQLSRGLAEALPLIVAPYAGIGMLALLLIWRSTVLTATVFLLGGAVLSVAVPVIGLAVDPGFADSGPYLINRVAAAICLVGAVGGSAVSGLLWSAVGFVVAQSSVVVGLALAGSPVGPGSGPLIVFSISAVAYLTLALAQRQSARRLEPLRTAEREVQDLDDRRALERRAAGVVHDTVLADLTAIARSPGALSDHASTVLSEHLRVVDAASVGDTPAVSSASSALGDAVLDLVHDYQWSGVRIDVSGVESLHGRVSSSARHAVIGAVRAALDNVVQHASTDRAEIVVGERAGQVTVLVVDDGVGFDPAEIADDRLGVRTSITDRITQVGGTVRVWSGPDGTTVMMTVPLTEAKR